MDLRMRDAFCSFLMEGKPEAFSLDEDQPIVRGLMYFMSEDALGRRWDTEVYPEVNYVVLPNCIT